MFADSDSISSHGALADEPRLPCLAPRSTSCSDTFPIRSAADSVTRSYIVHYQIIYPASAAKGTGTPSDTTLLRVSGRGHGKPSRTDTTDVNGIGTAHVQFAVAQFQPNIQGLDRGDGDSDVSDRRSSATARCDSSSTTRPSFSDVNRSSAISPAPGASAMATTSATASDPPAALSRDASGPMPRPAPGTLNAVVLRGGRGFDKPDALQFKRGGKYRPISHRDLLTRVRHDRPGPAAAGLHPGDRVAILSENRPEWAIADYACLTAGIDRRAALSRACPRSSSSPCCATPARRRSSCRRLRRRPRSRRSARSSPRLRLVISLRRGSRARRRPHAR